MEKHMQHEVETGRLAQACWVFPWDCGTEPRKLVQVRAWGKEEQMEAAIESDYITRRHSRDPPLFSY